MKNVPGNIVKLNRIFYDRYSDDLIVSDSPFIIIAINAVTTTRFIYVVLNIDTAVVHMLYVLNDSLDPLVTQYFESAI